MNQSKISFEFVRAPGVTVANVNGYWVYNMPHEKLLVELFYQHPKRTNSITHEVGENGVVGKEVSRDAAEKMVREILVSMELTPELAMDFGQYLVDTARSMGVKGQDSGQQVPPIKQ